MDTYASYAVSARGSALHDAVKSAAKAQAEATKMTRALDDADIDFSDIFFIIKYSPKSHSNEAV
jgi:hypothetical protein